MTNPWNELGRRVRAMHRVWSSVTDDLTLEQANHHERAGILPITFSLLHYVSGEDRFVSERLLETATIWSDDWAEKTGLTGGPIRRGTPIAVAEQARLTSIEAWLAYQNAVFARTEALLPELPVERYHEIAFETVPQNFAGGFVDLLADGEPLAIGDLMDALLYQHGMRHIGEIEHARSLVGLQGAG